MSWWAESIVAGSGAGETGVTRVVESASKPQLPSGDTGFMQGPFATKAEAETFVSTGAQTPGDTTTEQAPKNQIGNPLTGLAAIGNFFSKLGQANTWIRAVEVALGLGLLIAGVAKLAAGTSIGKTAAKVAGTAALL
jgi:hypothetical protein